MINMNNAMFALATGLLASVLASSSATAQKATPASGWIPGQPYVISVSTSSGIPLMVVAAGQIPLESEARVALFLPDLTGEDGVQELVYSLSIAADSSLGPSVQGKPQWVVGRVHKEFEAAKTGATLGSSGSSSAGGSYLLISADGLQHVIEHDLSDDIVWNDPCDFGGYSPSAAGTLGDGDAAELSQGDQLGTLTATTQMGGTSAQGL